MKKILIIIVCSIFTTVSIFAQSTKAELEKAQKSGKSIYLIVTDKSAEGTDALVKIVSDAQKKVKNVAVIKLDRDDKANAGLISEYRLSGTSLPIILILASNGIATAGLKGANVTMDKLISSIPTKTQAKVLLGFQNGKAALIVCGKKNAPDKANIEAECKKAVVSLENKAIQVFVDIDNKDEANFLTLLKPDLTKTTVLVFNGKGEFTGTLDSSAKSDKIIATVKKKVGSCCAGGSGNCGK